MFRKKNKILSTKRPLSYFLSTTELSNYVQNNLSFVDFDKKLPRTKSLVVPYVLVTDCKHLLCGLDEVGNLFTGHASIIYKKSPMRPWTRRGFDHLINETIVSNFFELYEHNIEVKGSDGIRDLSNKDIQLIDSGHSITNLDLTEIFPIYIVTVNPELTVRFPSSVENVALVPLDRQNLQNHSVVTKMSLPDRQVSFLISSEHIKLGNEKSF